MGKTTENLNSILKNTKDIGQFMEDNESHFAERNLGAYLHKLLKEKNMKKSDVFKRAGGVISASYGYDIFNNNRKPTRNIVIALCFGLGLNPDEANHLLNYASLGILYPRIRRDSIIIFALSNNIDIDKCNYLLMDSGEETIHKDNFS